MNDKAEFSTVLSKLCGHEISWVAEKHSDRFNGQANGMERFNAFWGRKKGRVSFSCKGAGAAKRWVLQELERGRQPTESNEHGAQDSCLPPKSIEVQSKECGVRGKEIRRSSRIRSTLHTMGADTEEQMLCNCAACGLAISHNFQEQEIVKCTKCANMFHPACSGIQDGWLGHLKFQCTMMEIDCQNHGKVNEVKKRGSATVHRGGKLKCHSDAQPGNLPENSRKRPLSHPSSENSGLTQEMRNLEIAGT